MRKAGAILIILLTAYTLYSPKKHAQYTNLDGMYVLSRIDSTGIYPLLVWDDPEWAYYFCSAERENRINAQAELVKMHIVSYTCGKFYGGEV